MTRSAQQRKEWWSAILRGSTLFLVLAVLILNGFVMAIVSENQQTSLQNQRTAIEIQKNNRRVLQELEDCTTPGGKCYKRGQAQQAKAVQLLIDEIRKDNQIQAADQQKALPHTGG